MFPLLEFYNQTGQRVYIGHEARTNAQALQDFDELEATSPSVTSPSLRQTMIEVRQIVSIASTPVPSGRGTVFTIDLDQCRACSLQDDYLSLAKPKLLQNGINIIQLNILRTSIQTTKGN